MMKFNLLALLKDDSLRRIVTNGKLQDDITQYFSKMKEIFIKDKTEILFDGRYRVEEDEIFAINGFQIDQTIIDSLQNPLTLDLLDLKKDILKALICGHWNKKDKNILFQAFDSRKVLEKQFTLIHTKNTYNKMGDPGIIIGTHLDIIYEKSKLLFYSYHNARKVFDLYKYYREATNEDLTNFLNISLFDFDNQLWFIENADSTMRKKIALLQKNKVLESSTLDDIYTSSKDFGITLQIVGKGNKRKIKLPENKKQIKEIIKFLDEDYFIAPLTKRRCLTNSKRYLDA